LLISGDVMGLLVYVILTKTFIDRLRGHTNRITFSNTY
jgi:hypothetical protein